MYPFPETLEWTACWRSFEMKSNPSLVQFCLDFRWKVSRSKDGVTSFFERGKKVFSLRRTWIFPKWEQVSGSSVLLRVVLVFPSHRLALRVKAKAECFFEWDFLFLSWRGRTCLNYIKISIVGMADALKSESISDIWMYQTDTANLGLLIKLETMGWIEKREIFCFG